MNRRIHLAITPRKMYGMRNTWFEKRRDFFVRKVIDEFFQLNSSFQAIYLLYIECRTPQSWVCSDLLEDEAGEIREKIWNSLTGMVGSESAKGPLWRLKDSCHLVWPEDDAEHDVSGSLVDWLIGSIFHEAMKLKENMYLLNRYGPAACRMKELPVDAPVTPATRYTDAPRVDTMIDVQGVINRAASDVVSQMEQIAHLFNHACFMLRIMMPDLAGNTLVVRLLIEREKMVEEFWGESLESLFQDMFWGDAAEGFCLAGRSYLKGQWFVQALKMYQKALAVNTTCDEAITRMVQLQAVVRENRELLGAV